MIELLIFTLFLNAFANESAEPSKDRTVASEVVQSNFLTEPVKNDSEAADSGDWEDGIAESINFDPNATPEVRAQQEATYAAKLCEADASTCITKVGGPQIHGQLVRRNGKYYFDVTKGGAQAYSCLASPGKNGRTNSSIKNKRPYGLEKLHVVTGRKKWKGAKMPWVVWVSGDIGVHAGHVTGQRASHGCIRIACAERFFRDVSSTGIGNVTVSVINN